MKNSADRGGCYDVIHRGQRPRWITPSEICRILHIPRKPNSIFVLLFLQNNSKFKNRLKHVASPQTSFGVRLSRIHWRNECVTNEPQRTPAGRLKTC